MPDAQKQFMLSAATPFVAARFGYVAAWDTSADSDHVVASATSKLPESNGQDTFAGAMWFTRRRDLHPIRREPDEPKAGTLDRTVELTPWTSDPPCGLGSVLGFADADGAATLAHGVVYHLDAVITPSGSARRAIGDQGAGITLVLLGESDAADVALQYPLRQAGNYVKVDGRSYAPMAIRVP